MRQLTLTKLMSTENVDAVTVRCTQEDTVLQTLVEVGMELEEVKAGVRAATSESLPVSVLLGMDIDVRALGF